MMKMLITYMYVHFTALFYMNVHEIQVPTSTVKWSPAVCRTRLMYVATAEVVEFMGCCMAWSGYM